MAIFNKTTNIEFQEYGEVYTETTFKNDLSSDRYYVTITGNSTNFLLKSDENTYFRVKEGIAAVVITDDINKEPKTFIIHRVCKLNSGLYYNFISISNESLIEVTNYSPNINRYKIDDFSFKSLVPSVRINSILGAYFVVRGPNYSFPGEVHNFWELTYVDEGELITNIDDICYRVPSQNLIFYAPKQLHTQSTENTCSYLTLIFDMSISESDADILKNKIFNISQKSREYLTYINKKISTQNNHTADYIASSIYSLIVDLLAETDKTSHYVASSSSMLQKYNNELLSEIVLYIQENIYSSITVEELCYKFALSRSSIQLLFKTNLDTTPKEYICDLKFNKAKQMIKESAYSISEIASFCGFSSIHYFSRKFKEKFGVNPSTYAKSIN